MDKAQGIAFQTSAAHGICSRNVVMNTLWYVSKCAAINDNMDVSAYETEVNLTVVNNSGDDQIESQTWRGPKKAWLKLTGM